MADYSRVIALDPGNAHAYHNRGISYDKKGLYEAAIAGECGGKGGEEKGSLRGCAAGGGAVAAPSSLHHPHRPRNFLPPPHPPALARRSADFTRVLELDGTNANAYFNRGSTHDSLGAYDKAIADYSRALDLDRQAQLASAAGGAGGAGAPSGPASAAALSSPPGPAAPATAAAAGASRGGAASPGAGTPWKQPQLH